MPTYRLAVTSTYGFGENEKFGREASRSEAKLLSGFSGKRRGETGRYAKQFNLLKPSSYVMHQQV
jgi:hypothetical protein